MTRLRVAQPVGGVEPVAAPDADDATPAPVTPPPSIDGKGTRVNTYA